MKSSLCAFYFEDVNVIVCLLHTSINDSPPLGKKKNKQTKWRISKIEVCLNHQPLRPTVWGQWPLCMMMSYFVLHIHQVEAWWWWFRKNMKNTTAAAVKNFFSCQGTVCELGQWISSRKVQNWPAKEISFHHQASLSCSCYIIMHKSH